MPFFLSPFLGELSPHDRSIFHLNINMLFDFSVQGMYDVAIDSKYGYFGPFSFLISEGLFEGKNIWRVQCQEF